MPKKFGMKAIRYLSLNDSFKNSSQSNKLQIALFESANSDFLQQLIIKTINPVRLYFLIVRNNCYCFHQHPKYVRLFDDV